MVKHLPIMQETLVWEDLLEKEMATHSSILVWKIPWTEETRGLRSVWSQRVAHTHSKFRLHTHLRQDVGGVFLLECRRARLCAVSLGCMRMPCSCSHRLLDSGSTEIVKELLHVQ